MAQHVIVHRVGRLAVRAQRKWRARSALTARKPQASALVRPTKPGRVRDGLARATSWKNQHFSWPADVLQQTELFSYSVFLKRSTLQDWNGSTYDSLPPFPNSVGCLFF